MGHSDETPQPDLNHASLPTDGFGSVALIELSPLVSTTTGVLVLFVGKRLNRELKVLRNYSIPEPVSGGLLVAILLTLLYLLGGPELNFNLDSRDFLLVYFFTTVGMNARFSDLLRGGPALFILLGLTIGYMTLQNVIGVTMAGLLGLQPATGLLLGTVSLIGGHGTTIAWAPTFVESFGIGNALELGVAANTMGLIAACVIGGPIARFLITRNKILPNSDDRLDIGVGHENEVTTQVDSYGILWAWLWLNVAMMIGYTLNEALEVAGLKLPLFVSCLIGGILIGNARNFILKKDEAYQGAKLGIALISDISLGMFLTMALMGLQVWELQGLLLFITVVMLFQILLSISFTIFIVFRAMGKDYEASVISAGFGGITLGSTATAIVNMTAVAKQYGAAHRAFIVVPLVCGFFIDLVNALIINFFVGL